MTQFYNNSTPRLLISKKDLTLIFLRSNHLKQEIEQLPTPDLQNPAHQSDILKRIGQVSKILHDAEALRIINIPLMIKTGSWIGPNDTELSFETRKAGGEFKDSVFLQASFEIIKETDSSAQTKTITRNIKSPYIYLSKTLGHVTRQSKNIDNETGFDKPCKGLTKPYGQKEWLPAMLDRR